MLKKTITYTDYNDVTRTETFLFGFNKAELLELQITSAGGYQETLQRLSQSPDVPATGKIFKELILGAYGEKSADGRRFIKSPQMAEEFTQTEAYSQLYLELFSDVDKMNEFFIGIMPTDVQEQMREAMANQDISSLAIVE